MSPNDDRGMWSFLLMRPHVNKLDCQFSEIAKCPAKVHVTLPEPGACCNISDPLISVIIYSLQYAVHYEKQRMFWHQNVQSANE